MDLPTCITPTGRVIDAILGVPLNQISFLLGLNRVLPYFSFGLVLLNSLSAGAFFYFVAWLFVRIAKRGMQLIFGKEKRGKNV
ncbi:hypothetical protein [Dyella sp. 2HG41-7]|uniref:hypothetical protein n=1 Tax=Dyella sp. 2HG41-7 TaxID=2883239 RepID=UPI001F31DEAE|nr:hypothetical protein [Dyella sp. 2HG41-7]